VKRERDGGVEYHAVWGCNHNVVAMARCDFNWPGMMTFVAATLIFEVLDVVTWHTKHIDIEIKPFGLPVVSAPTVPSRYKERWLPGDWRQPEKDEMPCRCKVTISLFTFTNIVGASNSLFDGQIGDIEDLPILPLHTLFFLLPIHSRTFVSLTLAGAATIGRFANHS
jgi:hypothetical protein